MIVPGSHTFAMFYVHAHMRYVKNGEYPSHITLMTFTQFAQNSTVARTLLTTFTEYAPTHAHYCGLLVITGLVLVKTCSGPP